MNGWNFLTDEDRERAMRSMPDMLEGFMKTWGWLHFAKAIEIICFEKNHLKNNVSVESIRSAGGIVHSDGNIFFKNIDQLRSSINQGK